MPKFDPQKVSAPLLTQVKQALEAEGLQVAHLVIAYDGADDGNTYVIGSHFYPQIEEHGRCLTFLTQTMLHLVGPPFPNESCRGYVTTYNDDGTIIVLPHTMTFGDDDEGGDEE